MQPLEAPTYFLASIVASTSPAETAAAAAAATASDDGDNGVQSVIPKVAIPKPAIPNMDNYIT